MGDMGDDFRAMKDHRQEVRRRLGVDCPGCIQHHPKRSPTKLMPGQECRVCGHVDERPRDTTA